MRNLSDSLIQKKIIKIESLNDIGAKRRDQRSTRNENKRYEKCNCKLSRKFKGQNSNLIQVYLQAKGYVDRILKHIKFVCV